MIKEINLKESAEDMHQRYFNQDDQLDALSIKGVYLSISSDSQYFKDGNLREAIKRELKRYLETFKADEEYYIKLMTSFIEVTK